MKKISESKFFRIFDITKLPHDLARLFISPLLLFYRVKKYDLNGNKYRKPIRNSAVIAANHSGFHDPLVMSCVFWYRRLSILVAEVVMNKPVIGFLLRGMGCIKIDRNISDIEAVRKSLAAVRKGRPLLIFPQGHIHRDGGIDDIKSGFVFIASKYDTPIIPVYSFKRKHWYNRALVVIGDEIKCSDYFNTKKMPSMADIAAVNAALESGINACRETYLKLSGKEMP